MCDFNENSIKAPWSRLADLMNAELGTAIDPRLLRAFIVDNWRPVTAYAHAIHAVHEADIAAQELERSSQTLEKSTS